jgi:L-fuconolactonase
MTVDAHQHLWDPTTRRHPFLEAAGMEALRRPFGLRDLADMCRRIDADATVLVQTVSDQAETEEFLAAAGQSQRLIAGVVGWVPLWAADVADRLAALRGRGPLVGVRRQVEDEADPAWPTRPDVARGLRAVCRLGLVYDLLVRHETLPVACQVVRSHPDLVFVLDHAAKPPIAAGQWEPWARDLRAGRERQRRRQDLWPRDPDGTP